MKIAYVYDAVYPWIPGGIQKRVWELARRLASTHDVHWYGLHYWDGPPTLEREGVTIHGVTELSGELYSDGRQSITEPLKFSASLVETMLRERFDIIDCQEFPFFPCFPCKLNRLVRGGSLVVTWHEVWQEYWYWYLGWKGVIGKGIERAVATVPDANFAVSERTQLEVKELGATEVILTPNGVSMDSIDGVEPVDNRIDFLFVGRLIKEKNPVLLVDALAKLRARLPGFRCVIVGEGPELEAVRERVRAYSLQENVEILEFRDSHEEIIGLMKAADVFVLPSKREGFGITALEALASGTPVVTIEHPQNAARELVEHGHTGQISDTTDESLADGLVDARKMDVADTCRSVAREYDWNVIADNLEDTYREITACM